MLARKYLGLLFMAMAVVAMLFGATAVEATCSTAQLSAATCFDAGGYEVTTVSPFPLQISEGSAIFYYTIAPLPGTSKNVSTIDILVPVCNSDFNFDGIVDNLIQISTGDPNGWRSYPPGQGSSNTNYGMGVYQDSVFEQNFNIPTSGQFYLHTTRAVSGGTSMGLKIGNSLYAGLILGPACYLPKVASTVEQVIQLDPLIPSRFWTILKDADGTLLQILDENNQPLALQNLGNSPVWVCVDPILDSSGNYSGCNSSYLPITYMPDGVGRFGKHTCYYALINGTYTKKCY
jgi:hypothetical protein